MATALASSSIGLREAAGDPRLFGLELSDRQGELLDVIEQTGTTIVACGRQAGKTLCASIAATHNAVLRPDLDARSRSPRHIVTVANSKAQAQILIEFVRSFLDRSPLLGKRVAQMRDDRITFTNGATIIAMPCEDRLARGLACSMLAFDEAGWFVDGSGGPRVLERVYAALRPATVTFGAAARTVMLSTPGQAQFFETMFRKAETGELPDSRAFAATSQQMNPMLDATYLEAERVALGEMTYRAEYEGAFLGAAAGAYFNEEDVRACVGRYRTLEPSDGIAWTIGVDPSFSNDPSAVAIVGRDKDDRRRLVVALTERWQPTRTRAERRRAKTAAETAEVAAVFLDRVADLSRLYGHAPAISDSHLAAVVKEQLAARGVRVIIAPWNPRSLREAFSTIRAHVLAGSISFPDDPELFAEMMRVRVRTRSGQPTIELPRSVANHCDQVAALASSIHRLEAKGLQRAARALSSFRQQPRTEGASVPARATKRARVYSPAFGFGYGGISDEEIEEINRRAVWTVR